MKDLVKYLRFDEFKMRSFDKKVEVRSLGESEFKLFKAFLPDYVERSLNKTSYLAPVLGLYSFVSEETTFRLLITQNCKFKIENCQKLRLISRDSSACLDDNEEVSKFFVSCNPDEMKKIKNNILADTKVLSKFSYLFYSLDYFYTFMDQINIQTKQMVKLNNTIGVFVISVKVFNGMSSEFNPGSYREQFLKRFNKIFK